MNKRVTIMDIARETNVTHTTVYKALNNKPSINENTRMRIMETAAAMGYRANKVAQSLVRKSMTIGIIMEGYDSEYSRDLVRGINDGLDELFDDKIEGIFTEFEPSGNKDTTVQKIMELAGNGIDGIIFMPYAACQEYIEMIDRLNEQKIPVILVTAEIPDSRRVTAIRPNGRLVGSIGAELLHLVHSGNKNAVFIGNKNVIHHQEIIDSFAERNSALGKKMIAVYETQDDDMIAYYCAERLFKDHPEVDGIFIGTSHSVGICRKITEIGLKGRVAVISTDIFNELTEYIENDTVKATIYQNSYRQGKLAVREMFGYLTGNHNVQETIFVNPEILIKSNYRQYLYQENK